MMRYPGVTTGSAGNLALGISVGSTASYGSGAVTVGSAAGNWVLNASNYFGFRFVAADGGTHYAWGRFDIGASIFGADRKIMEIAFDNVIGTPINVGTTDVPPQPDVPGPLPLLGAASAFAWSRRLRQRLGASSPPTRVASLPSSSTPASIAALEGSPPA